MSDTGATGPTGATPSTAADAAVARDQAEEQARLLYAAVLAYVVLHDAGEDPAHDDRLIRAARTLAVVLLRGVRRQFATKPSLPTGEARERWIEDRAVTTVRQAVAEAREHHRTVAARVLREDPAASDRMVDSTFRADKAWAEAAARTKATAEAARAAMEMLPTVEADTGEPHSKLWISRGDPKVRASHRKLHGRVRSQGDSFLADQTLDFPGDPRATPEERINCRCALFLVPSSMKAKAEDVFTPDPESFDRGLAASAVPFVVERAERELRGEMARSYEVRLP